MALACRSFFCWFLVRCLAGAVPTLPGGGELARDTDVEVIDTLSEIRSLTGVPGGFTEDRLPRRDGKFAEEFPSLEVALAWPLGGVSFFEVGNTRIVRVFPIFAPEVCEAAVTGVSGCEIADVVVVLVGISS